MKAKNLLIAGLVVVGLLVGGTAVVAAMSLNGAGASFPYPLYSQWAYKYNQLTGDQINYQSIGSGGGIAQIKAKTVDFAGSDAPLEKPELDASGLIQFPMVVGGVVPAINVPGIKAGQFKLTPDALANIYLGKITRWNDAALKAINPGLALPDLALTVVFRSDGSGTTWIYTNYLSKVSTEWRQRVGAGKSVSWPTGVGGKGNEGVAAFVQKTKGAIGYVEFAYAVENKMTYAALRNQAGAFVEPTSETFQAAAANADWPNAPGFYMVLTDQPGAGSWPITGATFILTYRQQPDANKAAAMLKYFDWCYHHGADVARKLNYVPMPENVIKLVQARWAAEIRAGGRRVWP
jgi:phosphate transport system substrate-binding protein